MQTSAEDKIMTGDGRKGESCCDEEMEGKHKSVCVTERERERERESGCMCCLTCAQQELRSREKVFFSHISQQHKTHTTLMEALSHMN